MTLSNLSEQLSIKQNNEIDETKTEFGNVTDHPYSD